ncbi:hypothetical protein [Demequina subtropica]|uniref:hypothetical protein n=1 Tax=Demequina subtropica TaxID=1638989 RepID=UPI0007820516|nr:hypothetical protein [Demequina subtropica]
MRISATLTALALLPALLAGCSAEADEAPAPASSPGAGLDGKADADGDLLSDAQEAKLGTDPHLPDTDGDGLEDLLELVTTLTDPTLASTDGLIPDGESDIDGDGLGALRERELGTDLITADTDGDGLDDGAELEFGTDPLLYDSDGDGISDGLEAAHALDPLAVDEDGNVTRTVLEGDVTVTVTGEAGAVTEVRAARGADVRWDESPVVLTDSVDFFALPASTRVRFEVETVGLDADPDDVAILLHSGDGEILDVLEPDGRDEGVLSFEYEVDEPLEHPTFGVIDHPAWLAFFEDFDY